MITDIDICKLLSNTPLIPEKYYTYLGSSFIKLTTDKTENILRQDQLELESKINQIRDGLKDKVRRLKSMQDHHWNTGFDLKAV